jgi:hypothetical protein
MSLVISFTNNIKRNKILVSSTFLFILLFCFICYIEPTCFFKQDGSVRSFGVGYKNKTIIPIWLAAIVLAILIYLFVQMYFFL